MAAKTSWHRYELKLRHCHAMYTNPRTHSLTHSLAVATQRLRYVVADAVLVSVLAVGGDHGSRDRGRARRGRTHWHQGVRRRAHLLHRSQRHGLQPTDPGTASMHTVSTHAEVFCTHCHYRDHRNMLYQFCVVCKFFIVRKKCTCTAVVRSAVRKSNIVVLYLCGSSVSCAFGVCIMRFMCIWAKCLK